MARARTMGVAVLLLCAFARVAQASDRGPSAAAQLPPIEYFYEAATVRGNDKTTDGFFRQLLGLEPGDRVSVDELDRFRRRLMATGFFQSVEARLTEGSAPETVIVEVEVEERNTILVNEVFLGVSVDTPLWGGLDLAETNLLGTGMLLAGAFVLSSDQGAVRLNLADPWAAVGIPFAWDLEGRYTSGTGTGPRREEQGRPAESAFEYRRAGGRFGVSYPLLEALSLGLDYRIEALHFRHVSAAADLPRTGLRVGSSLLSNLALGVEWETRDHELLPSRGYRAGLVVEGGDAFLGSDYRYLSLTGHADAAFRLGVGHVLRLDLSGGALWSNAGRAPFFDGFYIGDITALAAGRDLDLQFTDRRSLDFLDNGADLVTYGDRFARLRTEWAYRLSPASRPHRVEVFLSAGLFGIAQGPWDIGRPAQVVTSDTSSGAEDLHLDLTMNLGLRADTTIGFFAISLGSALSLAPLN